MNQDKRQPDFSTNVPQGSDTESSGRTDVEHEVQGEEENAPIERSSVDQRESGSIERAKAHLEHAGRDLAAAASEVATVARAAAESAKDAFKDEVPSTRRTGEPSKESTLDRLNDLLRGELASVETYELALRSVRDADLTSSLRQLLESHERRVDKLRNKVSEFGGEPAQSSGVWGAFARIVQRGADLLGHRAALAALEEGEDQGKKRYARDLDELEPPVRDFVLQELAPEQQRTHDLAQSLQKFVKAA
ncbi:DUF2383 domain-containing protein [Polyangium jinanense]|uniref:DUF2383 domain-containing protein n=1 Tax=Polyangium jinanense TaxID=2829994 RepID=A0A9X3WWP7_9BACT|nr:DUF2383 domain-containing protein [Polyangium jinanense]MDC3953378.1 DUF2383 domain-containing protein [Polyangium jinanense]MDC3979502.1 DUF2383 domain-containing protein [Polyangium jinanense]